jgi:hypothetical protein
MFDRFSGSARAVVFRGRDHAASEGQEFIEPKHILFALIDLHPALFERLVGHNVDIQAIRGELAPSPNPPHVYDGRGRLRLNEQSKRIVRAATEEARYCWERWEVTRRGESPVFPDDLSYWESRSRRTIRIANYPRWISRWILRRGWEVDERHMLLGLLGSGCPEASAFTSQVVDLEDARRRLCAKAG